MGRALLCADRKVERQASHDLRNTIRTTSVLKMVLFILQVVEEDELLHEMPPQLSVDVRLFKNQGLVASAPLLADLSPALQREVVAKLSHQVLRAGALVAMYRWTIRLALLRLLLMSFCSDLTHYGTSHTY